MNKTTTKQLALFMSLLLLFMVLACEKEDPMHFESPQSKIATYTITSLEKLKALEPIINNVKKMDAKTSALNRGFENFLPLENIDTTKVIQYTDSTGYSTYTFKIENENENSINFENLHLLETEEGYIAYILSWEPEPSWYDTHLIYQHGEYVLDMNNYVGDITKYSLEREMIWTTKQEAINRGMAYRDSNEPTEQCFSTIIAVCTCNTAGHEDPVGTGCSCIQYFNSQECFTGSGGGNNTTSGGGNNESDCNTTSGTAIIDEQPLSGIEEGCTDNDNTGVIIGSETDETTVDERNCEELNKLTSNTTYNSPNPYLDNNHPDNQDGLNAKIRIAITNIGDNLDSNFEHGFGFYNRGNIFQHGPYAQHVPASENRKVRFKAYPYQYGSVHTHPDEDTTIPMFSHDDIYSVLDMKNNYTIDLLNNSNPNGVNLFVCVLVVRQAGSIKTYALKINDIEKLQNIQTHKETDAKWKDFGETLRDKYEGDANGVDGTIVQYQKVFLEFLRDNDLGVSLYEMEQENAGTPFVSEKWSKLTLNANSPNGIRKQPCND